MTRIFLSPPDTSPADLEELNAAFREGWIAPVGPHIAAFEEELAAATGRRRAVALSSGTAALHLALIVGGVGPGDRVLVSTLTFAATANAVRYVGAEPVFVDSDHATWNLDPELVAAELNRAAKAGQPYKAVVAVDLYGQCANYRPIAAACQKHGALLLSDAAEALGAELDGHLAGSFGEAAVLSFNGNKIITTSGGGALVTDRDDWADKARFLATQARDPFPHYEHSELGYNYRLSNLLAALGRSQLRDLKRRVDIRRSHNHAYRQALSGLPGVCFMPEIEGGRSTFWLTALTIDPMLSGRDRNAIMELLESEDIEARPVWKPMHRQPLYRDSTVIGSNVADELFDHGICLPSGSTLQTSDRQKIIELMRQELARSR